MLHKIFPLFDPSVSENNPNFVPEAAVLVLSLYHGAVLIDLQFCHNVQMLFPFEMVRNFTKVIKFHDRLLVHTLTQATRMSTVEVDRGGVLSFWRVKLVKITLSLQVGCVRMHVQSQNTAHKLTLYFTVQVDTFSMKTTISAK